MPSAAKSEMRASTEVLDPLRQAITIMEHKIRNLEKRKGKLDSYKESGKPLTKEQEQAVSKYDEVTQLLELSREYVKQFNSIISDTDKMRKKMARKEAQERAAADINKIKQVLIIQDVLQNMGSEAVREDFLAGKNGAAHLTEDDLKALDDLYLVVSPKHESEEGVSYNDQAQKAAENFLPIIEGKPKEAFGTTFAKIKQTIFTIHGCGYFDQSVEEVVVAEAIVEVENPELPDEEEEFHETQEILTNVIVPSHQQPPQTAAAPPTQQLQPPNGLPPTSQIPNSTIQPMPTNLHQPQTDLGLVNANVQNIVPTPVSQVESSFFNAQGFKPPAPPGSVPTQRAPSDVISNVTSNFNFLQESELETNEFLANNNPQQASGQAIPTRTFTNQAFNGQPNIPQQQQTNNFQAYSPMYNQPAELNQHIPGFTTNTLPMPPNRPQLSSNVNFNQTTQPIVPNFNPQQPTQPVTANYQPQTQVQQSVIESKEESVKPNDLEQQPKTNQEETPSQDWAAETGWAGVSEWSDTNEWTSQSNQTERQDKCNNRSSSNRGSGGRMGSYGGGGNRGRNNYQSSRQSGYSGNSNNYYQNGYQNRNERNNDYNKDYRDRGDSNRPDNGFKKGPGGPRNRPPMGDRGDRPTAGGPPRNNNGGGTRPPRNPTRPNSNGQNYSRPAPGGKQ